MPESGGCEVGGPESGGREPGLYRSRGPRARVAALAVRRPGFRRRRPERWNTNERRHQFRLWVLGTLVMMVLVGGMAGSLMREDLNGDIAVSLVPIALVLVPIVGLMALWFHRGYRLWQAIRLG